VPGHSPASKEWIVLMIGLLVASPALRAEERRPTVAPSRPSIARSRSTRPSPRRTSTSRARAITRAISPTPRCADLLLASPSAAQPTSRQYFPSDSAHRDQRGRHRRAALDSAARAALDLAALQLFRPSLSTADVFDYDQHAVGIPLNVNLARAL